ncbi:predicted GPI-anchored protein 58 [Miscanthus floridulus]|uniref:predicted GPI-anchored protein 58 n=1 Tax=Miscanthus floridulus TaxID=154761 RepID=UPI00345AB8F2
MFLSLFLSTVPIRAVPASAAANARPPACAAAPAPPRPQPHPHRPRPRRRAHSCAGVHARRATRRRGPALPHPSAARAPSPTAVPALPACPRQPSCPRALTGRPRPAPPCTVRRAVPAPTRHAKARGSSGPSTPRRFDSLLLHSTDCTEK